MWALTRATRPSLGILSAAHTWPSRGIWRATRVVATFMSVDLRRMPWLYWTWGATVRTQLTLRHTAAAA